MPNPFSVYTMQEKQVQEKETQQTDKKPVKKPLLFRIIVKIVRFCYGKWTVEGVENIPKTPSIIASNHAQMHGPLTFHLFFPGKKRIWCIGQMMNSKEIPDYAFEDFWHLKPKRVQWFYRIVSHLIAPLSYIFKHADTLPVYKDTRIISTFKNTVSALADGNHIVIFPEKRGGFNGVVNDFQDKFIDVARLYYKRYGVVLSFVPTYNAPELKKIVFGKPIAFDPEKDMETQRAEMVNALREQITQLAKDQPRHKVVPYDNIAKKDYPYSKEENNG